MKCDRTCTVRARMASLDEANAFVESFCAERGVARADCLRLSLIVEELLTNTVMHGHGGDCDAPVRIALGADPREIELRYEDTAPPFDPRSEVARATAERDRPAPEREVGRLGILLVAHLAAATDYARDDGWNRLRIAMRREEASDVRAAADAAAKPPGEPP